MTRPSALTKVETPFILDTSVLINLHASTYGERILTAIPNNIVIPKIVAGELGQETGCKNGGRNFLNNLIERGLVDLASMTDSESKLFEKLVSGFRTLHDGEASTIAIAVERNYFPIIDDKIGRKRARELMAQQEPGWSVEVMLHPSVAEALGAKSIGYAVFYAAQVGRMHIPRDSVESVTALIGKDRIDKCRSIEGYKHLLKKLNVRY